MGVGRLKGSAGQKDPGGACARELAESLRGYSVPTAPHCPVISSWAVWCLDTWVPPTPCTLWVSGTPLGALHVWVLLSLVIPEKDPFTHFMDEETETQFVSTPTWAPRICGPLWGV